MKSASTGRSFSAVVISMQSFATTSGITTSIGLTAAFDSKCLHRSVQRPLLPRRSATLLATTCSVGLSTSTAPRPDPA